LTVRCPLGRPRNSPRTRGKYSARETVSTSLGQPSYASTIGHGDPAANSATVQRHLTAGADHVMVMLPGGDFVAGIGGTHSS
jgi:hypothetical protein